MSERYCFREAGKDAFTASELLSNAVAEHLAGNMKKAAKLFAEANIESIWDWWNSIAGPKSPYVKFRTVDKVPISLPLDKRIPVRMPNSDMIRRIHERDGFHCRFCGMPVIRKEIRESDCKGLSNRGKFWENEPKPSSCFLGDVGSI